jgi:hypothetical protein
MVVMVVTELQWALRVIQALYMVVADQEVMPIALLPGLGEQVLKV